MNSTRNIASTIATVAAAVIGFASATTASANSANSGEANYDYPAAYSSTLTRAEVLAQAQQAREAGLVATGERSVVAAPVGMAKTRAQVVAETLEAIRIGAIDRHEQSQAPTAMQLEQIRTAGERAVGMTVATR